MHAFAAAATQLTHNTLRTVLGAMKDAAARQRGRNRMSVAYARLQMAMGNYGGALVAMSNMLTSTAGPEADNKVADPPAATALCGTS